jgi:chaperonin GroES
MSFRPLHDRVVVRRIEQESKSKGGIIIPDTAKEKPQGNLHAPDVKAGDRVIFGKWSGSEIKIDGADFLVMKESDIIGVLETAAV